MASEGERDWLCTNRLHRASDRNEYRCARWLLYLLFFGKVLIGSSAATVTCRRLPFSAGVDGDGATLGELVSFTCIVERYVGATLGSAPLYEGSILVVLFVGEGSIGQIFFNCVVRSCRACRTGSPALREGMVGDGGCVNR